MLDTGIDLKGDADTLSYTAQKRQMGDALSIVYKYKELPDDEQFKK